MFNIVCPKLSKGSHIQTMVILDKKTKGGFGGQVVQASVWVIYINI